MPSSAVRTFIDPDEYAAAMRQATVALTVMQRGTFTAKLCRIDLHRLWMQRFSANLGWTSRIDYLGGQVTIPFQTRSGPNMMRNGRECAFTSVTRLNAGQSYYLHSPGPASYGTMSLPLDEMASLGVTFGGRDPTPPKDFQILTPSLSALAKLQRLHAAAGRLAEEAPEIIANPDAARGLEQLLIEAIVDCLGHAQEHENTLAQGQHAIVMRRFSRVLEENPEQPLFILEICKAIGVSERTLRACCQEHLGMSPKRYLLLRRMQLAQQALRTAAPSAATVTELATRYGFWQLGRFAVEYRALFGETPSATLQRQPD